MKESNVTSQQLFLTYVSSQKTYVDVMSGGHGVTVIVIGNGIGDSSSNSGVRGSILIRAKMALRKASILLLSPSSG